MSKIRNDLKKILYEPKKEPSILDKVKGKPGYDPEGLYHVIGSLTHRKVQLRKSNGSNMVDKLGLKIGRYNKQREIEETLFVTLDEALDLIVSYGADNAFVKQTFNKKKEINHFVYPHPSRTESFTRDDNIFFVFVQDDNGYNKRPYELNVSEEECSYFLWEEIKSIYKDKKAADLKQFKGVNTKEMEKMNQLKDTLKSRRIARVAVNPFRQGEQ